MGSELLGNDPEAAAPTSIETIIYASIEAYNADFRTRQLNGWRVKEADHPHRGRLGRLLRREHRVVVTYTREGAGINGLRSDG